MARRREGLFEILAAAPWPVGIVFGLAAFGVIRYGLAAWFSAVDNPYTSALGEQLARGSFDPFAWLVLALGALASLFSWLGSRKRRRLLDTRQGLASLQEISWQDFERLIGEVFRRRGYSVEETGGGGADGGVDLLLRKDGALELVQCKQYKRRQVAVSTVREIYGLLQHHKATKGWIVCCGGFTADARAFASDKPIELLTGDALLAAINEVRALGSRQPANTRDVPAQPRHPPKPASAAIESATAIPAPACPNCSSPMVKRTNRKTKEDFWGCSTYPLCRSTLK